MDLLLEKRCHLDTMVTKKEHERRVHGDSLSDRKHVRTEEEEGEGEGGREG